MSHFEARERDNLFGILFVAVDKVIGTYVIIISRSKLPLEYYVLLKRASLCAISKLAVFRKSSLSLHMYSRPEKNHLINVINSDSYHFQRDCPPILSTLCPKSTFCNRRVPVYEIENVEYSIGFERVYNTYEEKFARNQGKET